MIGEFSIMDWITLGGILTAIAGVLGGAAALWNIIRDNKALSKDHESLLKGQKVLSEELSEGRDSLSKELSKEHQSIKEDTKYISDEMKYEKMARENLYKNSTKAKEILETMDLMKEVVLQNSRLHEEVTRLTVANQELSKPKENKELDKVLRILGRIEGQLASLEDYRGTEEVQVVLKRVESELLELSN